LFFGLSGTGKTTLSADPDRALIGDDEHGWGSQGIFNLEGGCYAKTANLDEAQEPEIYSAIRPNALLENVVLDENRDVVFSDTSKTQNTRVSYPIEHIPSAKQPSLGDHAENIIFLTCDAFGVLPPLGILTPEQALMQFVSGYTAKVAGTELGVLEPQATFSSCFGGPFMTRHAFEYASLLKRKMQEHNTSAFLVNTGWTGGGYGVGRRMSISLTRSVLRSIFDGSVKQAPVRHDPIFGMAVPMALRGVPSGVLEPRRTWESSQDYDAARTRLAVMFQENLERLRRSAPEALKQLVNSFHSSGKLSCL